MRDLIEGFARINMDNDNGLISVSKIQDLAREIKLSRRT